MKGRGRETREKWWKEKMWKKLKFKRNGGKHKGGKKGRKRKVKTRRIEEREESEEVNELYRGEIEKKKQRWEREKKKDCQIESYKCLKKLTNTLAMRSRDEAIRR